MELYSISRKKGEIYLEKSLPKKNGLFYAFEYAKGKKSLMQIGIKSDVATAVYVRQKEITIALEKSKNNIWFHGTSNWKNGLYDEKTDGIFGLNVGGDFFVQCWKGNELIEEEHVAIIPQVFSLEEYRYMQQEVVQLIEAFSTDMTKFNQNEAIYLKRIQRFLYPLNQLEKIINQFIVVLEEIIDAPSFKLDYKPIKIHKQKIKRWTPQLLIEESVTQKEYLNTTQKLKSFNIIEHQMIRTMIEEFVIRINIEHVQEKMYIDRLNRDLIDLENTMKSYNSRDYNIFVNLKSQIEKEIGILIERDKMFEQVLNKTKIYLDIPLFNQEAIPVEDTHLFKMDIKYNEIFELYSRFKEIRDEVQIGLQPFIKSLLKSPTLYEVWILLKIVEQLTQWSFNANQFIYWIHTKYYDLELLEGFDEIFELPNMPFRIRVMFNFYFENFNMKPDYVIGVQNKRTGIWQWHTVDAKYKFYNQSTLEILEGDIDHSAKRYKNNISINGIGITSSSIIHPNKAVYHWNIKYEDKNLHTISHFYTTPFDTRSFRIYFKRLLHHFNKFEKICPTCNKQTLGEQKYENSSIYTYVCNSCGEVWVSSHCWSCKNNSPLYKYAIHNYNLQVKDEWNVHCPRCFADANGLYNQNKSILQESYHFVSHKPAKTVFRYESRETTCSRCNGRGRISMFRHIEGGICFACQGRGTIMQLVKIVDNSSRDLPF